MAASSASVYVAGEFRAPMASFGATALTNVGATGSSDVFVAKLTDAGGTGSFAWAQRTGGTDYDFAPALALSGTSMYVAGYVLSTTAGFDPITLANSNPGFLLGYLAAPTAPTLTATTAAGPREAVALFPNPARHAVTLRLPAGTTPTPLILTNAQGRTVRHYPAPMGLETVLALQGLPSSLYLLRGAGLAVE